MLNANSRHGITAAALLLALSTMSASHADDQAKGAAAAATEWRPPAASPAEGAAAHTVVQPGVDIATVAGTLADGQPCAPASGLDSFSAQLNGVYAKGGKNDSTTQLAFPDAPGAGSTLQDWLEALNTQLLETIDLRFNDAERAQYSQLEGQKCSTIYCQIAMRQKTAYYLLRGKQP